MRRDMVGVLAKVIAAIKLSQAKSRGSGRHREAGRRQDLEGVNIPPGGQLP